MTVIFVKIKPLTTAHSMYILKTFVRMVVWGREKAYLGFWWGNLRERDCLGEPDVDFRTMLRWIYREWDVGLDWIELTQDRDRWRTLVNAVMNFRIP